MANDGSVIIGTELDESGLKAGLDDLNKSVNTWGAAVVGSKAFQAITEGLIKTAKAGIEYNAQMEDYQTNFTVLLGDEAKALEYVAQMRETAAKTPFGMEDLASANQTLLSFGLTAEETQAAVQQLGDISMGNAERFSSLSLAFAQVSSAGKLTGQDLLQMINAGFNPLNTIAEKTGTSIGDLKEVMSGGKGSKDFRKQMKAAQKEVKKMGDQASEGAKWLAQIGTDGAISAEMIGVAMQAETAPGGRFYNGMEMASQTLSGMWSTLKDDSMQLLGNVFEPASTGIKKFVLPAAQTVVSTLNSLFEEDKSITLSANVQEAVTNLTTLDEDISALKDKWVSETIKIRLDAENAESLIQELEAVQAKLEGTPKRLWSEEDKTELQKITSELTGIYPELQKYVSNEGILKLEAQAVRDLCKEYQQLSLDKAAAEYKSETENRLREAQVNYKILEKEISDIEQRKKVAEETRDAFQTLSEESTAYSNQIAFALSTGREVDTTSIEGYLALIEKYIQLGGQFDSLNNTDPDGKPLFDLTHIFGETGEFKSAEEIAASADSLMSLAQLLAEINESNFGEEGANAQGEIVQQLAAEIDASAAALTESAATVTELAKQVEYAQAVLQEILSSETGAETGAETGSASGIGERIVNDAAQGVSDNSGTLETSVQGTVDTSAENADTGAFTTVGSDIVSGIASGVSANSGILAGAITSLISSALRAAKRAAMIKSPSRLFADEVGAYLSAGTAMGVDNNAWMLRKSIDSMIDQSIPDVSRIASSLVHKPLSFAPGSASAMAAASTTNQTINFNVPVQTPAEFANTMFLYSTYGLTEA